MKKLCALLLAGAMTILTAGAMAEAAPDNHWGASDVRLYLNNGARAGGVWQVDSTADSDNKSDYAAHFSDEEFARILPTVVETIDLVDTRYWTKDRFYLPSRSFDTDEILSRGEEDIKVNAVYDAVALKDVIPISYWAEGEAWLRSSQGVSSEFISKRGKYVLSTYVQSHQMVAPLFRVSLKNVTFASCASANKLLNSSAQMITIAGSDDYGEKSEKNLPEYGMYLKTGIRLGVKAESVTLDGNSLKIQFSQPVNQCAVVVCAYQEDNLTSGTTAYCAAAKMYGEDLVTIDVGRWGLPSLAGYTIKVWLENADADANLAEATTPETFVGDLDGRIVPTVTDAHNPRVFAMKDNLSCSWGTLANKDALVGANASNQKIYYGTYGNGKPMEFWIAGVEGNIMTLYQAKPVDSLAFKESNTVSVNNPAEIYKPEADQTDVSDNMGSSGSEGTMEPMPDEGETMPDEAVPQPETTGEGQMPQTGDASMLGAWVCLLGAAGAGLKIRRKH